ncbi:MAG: hypothetical protein APR54_07450 [Candidatus Cloacimonas sp. SDB]|nr:MAG: hypothetical protein APR54_07450 [Candidatus Cloacimonas sp. SDB]
MRKSIKESLELFLKHNDFNSIIRTVVKILVYAVILLSIFGILSIDANKEGKIFKENSLTEWSQIILILLSSIIFFRSGKIDKSNSSLMKLFIGILSILFIREFDSLLDKYVFNGAWQILVYIIVFLLFLFSYKHRVDLLKSINEFVSNVSFGIIESGMLILLVFSRLFGQKIFWRSVMKEAYLRSVKDVAEESLELLGYCLIFIGSIEFLLLCKRKISR